MSKAANPFRYFHSSPEIIRAVVMLYVRYPLSLRNVEDLLFERGYDLCHETVRLWWNRFGRCSPARSVDAECLDSGAFAIGVGIWMRCS